MKQKEKELLQLLVRHQGEYISSKYLAQTLSLSDRTVREYIKRLKVHTVGNGATIYAKAGVGYQFSVTQRVAFEQFYAPIDLLLTKDECESATSSERAERIAYILNKLLIEDETVEIEVMAEEMYLSRSSVSKILADIRRIIIPYELILQRMSFGGYCIVGTERHKRHLIMDYFYSQLPVTMIQQYIEPQLLFQDIRFEELTIIVLDECREGNLRLSDIIIQNLVLHLALSIKRIHAHLEMKELEEGVKERACEYEVAARIMRRVERVLSLRVPQAEIAYLALHLMAKSNNDHPLMDGRLACELDVVLRQMQQEVEYPFSEDLVLKNGLLSHLQPLLVRLQRAIKQDNPMLAEIIGEHQPVLEMTKRYLSKMPTLQPYEICTEEWAYLTLHILAAIEKAKNRYKKKALIICATGYGSAQLLKNRVNNEFGQQIIVTDIKGYYEISEACLTNIDVIISSINLSSMVFRVPVIHVSVLLSEQDVAKIRMYLHPTSARITSKAMVPAKCQASSETILGEIISEAVFWVSRVGETKEDVLQSLLACLQEGECIDYIDRMSEQMARRTKMGQILFSSAVAVPHPAIPQGRTTKVAVAIAPQGLYWDAHYQNIRFVFLISPSVMENRSLTQVTKAIVELVDRPDIQEAMLQNPTYEGFSHHFLTLMK